MKEYFQKGELELVEQTTELQKKQSWIKAKKLILNSSLASNKKMWGIAESLGFLQNYSQVKLKAVYSMEGAI